MDDDAVLDSVLVRRYGGKLYIGGDLTINRDSADALEQVSYLRVDGAVQLTRGMKNRVLGMDFACVRCSREQLPVVETLAQDVAHITCGEEEKPEEVKEDKDTVTINADVYTI